METCEITFTILINFKNQSFFLFTPVQTKKISYLSLFLLCDDFFFFSISSQFFSIHSCLIFFFTKSLHFLFYYLMILSFIILIILFFNSCFQLFHMRIILMLALSDLGTSVTAIASTWLRYYYAADLISNVKVNSLSYFLDPCILSGSVLQLFGLSSVIWSFCVANMIHLVISVHWDRVESMEKWYHLFGWLLPIASVVYVIKNK